MPLQCRLRSHRSMTLSSLGRSYFRLRLVSAFHSSSPSGFFRSHFCIAYPRLSWLCQYSTYGTFIGGMCDRETWFISNAVVACYIHYYSACFEDCKLKLKRFLVFQVNVSIAKFPKFSDKLVHFISIKVIVMTNRVIAMIGKT